MDTTVIAQKVRSFIVENFFTENDVMQDSTSFLEAGILDSTGVLQLLTFLEATYGVKVEDEEVTTDNLDSINNVVGYLVRKLSGYEGERPAFAGVLSGGDV